MRIGLTAVSPTTDKVVEHAKAAERDGFSSLWFASYLLGDSILQFSTVIGTYLFAMGIGSYLSRYFERQLVAHFLRIELMVGLVGGLMPAALFALQTAAASSFAVAARFRPSRGHCADAAGSHASWRTLSASSHAFRARRYVLSRSTAARERSFSMDRSG